MTALPCLVSEPVARQLANTSCQAPIIETHGNKSPAAHNPLKGTQLLPGLHQTQGKALQPLCPGAVKPQEFRKHQVQCQCQTVSRDLLGSVHCLDSYQLSWGQCSLGARAQTFRVILNYSPWGCSPFPQCIATGQPLSQGFNLRWSG